MNPSLGRGFLRVALELADRQSDATPITVAEIRRGISATYYALFHSLSKAFADALVGPLPEEGTGSRNAWLEVYRALDHTKCLDACKKINDRFSQPIQELCADMLQLYQARVEADYDPRNDPDFTKLNQVLGIAEAKIEVIEQLPTRDVKALGVWMLVHAHGTKKVRESNAQRR